MLNPRSPGVEPPQLEDSSSEKIAGLVINGLSHLIKEQRADAGELAGQTAGGVNRRSRQPEHPSPSEIADVVYCRLHPILAPLSESPTTDQTNIDAAVIERLKHLTSPEDIAEQSARKMADSDASG